MVKGVELAEGTEEAGDPARSLEPAMHATRGPALDTGHTEGRWSLLRELITAEASEVGGPGPSLRRPLTGTVTGRRRACPL